MTTKPATDWERIEREYRAGQLSVRQIGALCGVSHTAINKKAKAQGWVRDLADHVRKEVAARLVATDVSSSSAREAVETAAERGVAVIISHRSGLSRLKVVLDRLVGAAEVLSDQTATDESRARATLLIGDRESLSDLVEKVGRTLSRVIPLERQAFSLDAPQTPAAAHADLTDEQLDARLAQYDREAGEAGAS